MKKLLESIGFIMFLVGAGSIGSATGLPPVMMFGGLSIMILLNWKKGGVRRE